MTRIKSLFNTIWERIKQHPFLSISAAAVVAFAVLNQLWFKLGLTWPPATGFGEYWVIKINPTTNTFYEKAIYYRTLWDWLDLLIIPAVLAVGALWFNKQERDNDRNITEERNKNEQLIALDRQRETALQTYIDRMTDLLLKENDGLRESQPDDEIRIVARIRTLTTLRTLDDTRKGLLIRFLKEALLIDKNNTIVNLENADLTSAVLSEIDLNRANLSKTTLNKAYLFKTQLTLASLNQADLFKAYMLKSQLNKADLSQANLIGATLIEADLSGAKLVEANLTGAQMIGANLSQANLTRANLTRANLSRANLSNANLSAADLRNTNLKGADLSNAAVTPEQLSQARSLEKAVMPDGTVHG